MVTEHTGPTDTMWFCRLIPSGVEPYVAQRLQAEDSKILWFCVFCETQARLRLRRKPSQGNNRRAFKLLVFRYRCGSCTSGRNGVGVRERPPAPICCLLLRCLWSPLRILSCPRLGLSCWGLLVAGWWGCAVALVIGRWWLLCCGCWCSGSVGWGYWGLTGGCRCSRWWLTL